MIRKLGVWVSGMVGEDLVMMPMQRGHYIGLSLVGARVWELLDTPQSLDSLCEQLEQEFDVSREICREEVSAFIRELVQHKAAECDPE